MPLTLSQAIDQYQTQERIYSTEGQRGIQNLCQLCRAVGYKDQHYSGQMSSNASMGDLTCFLEDNPGAIEAIIEWMGKQNAPEMLASIKEHLHTEEDAQEDE